MLVMVGEAIFLGSGAVTTSLNLKYFTGKEVIRHVMKTRKQARKKCS